MQMLIDVKCPSPGGRGISKCAANHWAEDYAQTPCDADKIEKVRPLGLGRHGRDHVHCPNVGAGSANAGNGPACDERLDGLRRAAHGGADFEDQDGDEVKVLVVGVLV